MRNSNIRWVILLGAISILSIIAMQAYWLIHKWDQESKSFDQTTSIALLKVAREMADLNKSTLPSGEVIKRITPNYYIVNFNDVIDVSVLEYLLLKEFGSLGNYTDFEYAIYDCVSEDMVYGNHCNLIEADKPTKSDGNLPKYDEFNYYFGVKFPSRHIDLRTNAGLTWFLVLLAAITITFFSYAIWVIFNQRRYSEMQRDFINNMTHEFKTPLTSIQLSSDYLSKQPAIQSDERLQRYTELIRTQYQRLNIQVEKLLNVARLESGEFGLKREPIDMHQLLAEVLETKGAESGIEGHTFITEYKATHPMTEGDRTHLSGVISNLVDNAVKYSTPSTPITISTSSDQYTIEVAIADEGMGIAPTHQKHLFKKFYRVPSGNVHDIKGFGLGLHYVKTIMEMHGGDIGVESELGKGSTFTIKLPIKTK